MHLRDSNIVEAPSEQDRAFSLTHTLREAARHGEQAVLLCSFQKEESVLLHMLTSIEPDARVFMIDTGVLFEETLQTWKRFEDRFGVGIEVIDARSPDEPWSINHCCGEAKVEALERALDAKATKAEKADAG